MPDRRHALRALSRKLAAERSAERPAAPTPRPAGARIPLPAAHVADLAAARVHRVRLTAPALDADRFAAALDAAAKRHDALRLGPVRDSGRTFLAPLDDPVSRVADPAELAAADEKHPVRWSLTAERGRVTVTLAVSAYLVDRSCLGALLETVAGAYAGGGGPGTELAAAPELEYGDYCYWLASRGQDSVAATDGRFAVGADERLAAGADERLAVGTEGRLAVGADGRFAAGADERPPAYDPYAAFAATQPWDAATRPAVDDDAPRAVVVGALADGLADALRACGSLAEPLVIRRRLPREPLTEVLGRVDVEVDEGGCQGEVDVVDLPEVRLDGYPVAVEVELDPAPGWQCVLVRSPVGAQLTLAGAAATLPALHDALREALSEGPYDALHDGLSDADIDIDLGTDADTVAAAGGPPADLTAPARRGPTSADRQAPSLVTPQRKLSAEVVAGAVERRASELRAVGARPGDLVAIERTEGPECVANLLAAWACGADVLLGEPAAAVAVRVAADNTVHAAASPRPHAGGDGDGALLLPLPDAGSSSRHVVYRVPLGDLRQAASVLGELWELSPGRAAAAGLPGAAQDLALRVLACAAYGAPLVLLGADGVAAFDLLQGAGPCCAPEHLADQLTGPVHRLTDVRWTRHATDAAPDAVTTWSAPGAPGAQWLVGERGLTLRSGTARIVDGTGRPMPSGTVGELAIAAPPGSRYAGDPRRTAERLRPRPGGHRELRTGHWAGRDGDTVQLLQPNRAGLPRPSTGPSAAPDTGPSAGPDGRPDQHPAQHRDHDPPDATPPAPPVSPASTLAADIVSRVLDHPVRHTDDLFALGATSLQLMRVLLQVKQDTGVEVSLARFFAAPSAALLAELIDEPAGGRDAALELLDEIAGDS